MNKTDAFFLNGKYHYIGTVVNIKEMQKQYFGFHSILRFVEYNEFDNFYYFSSLYNEWEIYKLSKEQINMCFENVVEEGAVELDDGKIKPEYIDGIVSAWIWYILIILFALCLKNIGQVVMTLLFSTIIFFHWRHKKINGG